MSTFWRNWLTVWCWVVVLFGVVLAGAGLPATDGVARTLMRVIGGRDAAFDAPLRFSTALMGCVTAGWGLTMLPAFRAAHALSEGAAPVWRGLLLGVAVWFVADSALSIATGFGLNAVSNTLLFAALLVPLVRTRVLAA